MFILHISFLYVKTADDKLSVMDGDNRLKIAKYLRCVFNLFLLSFYLYYIQLMLSTTEIYCQAYSHTVYYIYVSVGDPIMH